ncbi:MAG: hypothetical protein OXF93_15095 [Acidobacteria bacterium]|nr:hypothetical protein [Acidobacteriota bacterium]
MAGETETSVSPLLRWLGFEVSTELARDWVELSATLRAFTRRRLEADVSLAFYAGHGIEITRSRV